MKKSVFKAIPILIISGSMLFAQYYDPYYYNNNAYQNGYNNYYSYHNYYQEFMNVLAREANNPNSIYYSPVFAQHYNNYGQMNTDPYNDTMNAMSAASSYYNQNYYGYNYSNPYEELMKMLEIESKNPNSPYYSPNSSYNQNNYYQYNNTQNTQAKNPYETAEALINAAKDSSINNNPSANNNMTNNNTENMQYDKKDNTQNFYTPFKVPKTVFNTASRIYPNEKIVDVEMENIGIYEVRLSNMMRLFIDRNGELLYEKTDY